MRWAYGVTTVPSRRENLLPRTLESLRLAGFDAPRLFVDGATPEQEGDYRRQWYGLECTFRLPKLKAFGNWALGLAELLIRNPVAERFAMFQDDLAAVKNLRTYLERCRYPDTGWWNLYTSPSNGGQIKGRRGWVHSEQYGRGAVGLVFSRAAVTTLLKHQNMVEKPLDVFKGWKSLDGAVSQAFKNSGWHEWVHAPSLVNHVGQESTIDKRKNVAGDDPNFPAFVHNDRWQAPSFPGEDFDAMELARGQPEIIDRAWDLEREALERAVADDRARLAACGIPQERRRYQRLIAEYEAKLRHHLALAQ